MSTAAAEAPPAGALRADFGPPANRMAVALLSLAGVFVSAYLLFHYLGFGGPLACGVSGGCETVQTSRYAWFLGVPVPALGVGGYLLLLGTSLAGLQPSLGDRRWVAAAILGLASIAFAFSMYLTALEAWVIRAWCRWCVGSALLATLIFLAALPEVRRLRHAGSSS